MSDPNIKPETQALCDRGNITLAEYKEFRGNSWEHDLVHKNLDLEALVHATKHNLDNCKFSNHKNDPCTTYEDALVNILAPELVRRCEELLKFQDELGNIIL